VTNQQPEARPPRRIGSGRLEAFSDGVFAIAITLLVLELAVPAGAEDDLLDAFLDQWPSYLAYVVSFATIGAIWLAHNGITDYLDRADAGFIRLNLLLLMVVSFLPFPTRLLGEHIGEESPERVAVTIYGLTLLAASSLVSVLWRYAVHEKLVRPDAEDEDVKLLTKRLAPGLAAYAIIIILGLFLPVVAVLAYLAVALFFIVPVGLLRQHLFG
jgi:TMEM175 potassium channel family protein